MAWHFFLMWNFAINGAAYVGYTVTSGEWRELLPNRQSWHEAIEVAPKQKFNGAQRIAYTGIVIAGTGSLLTGLAIYKPVQLQAGGFACVRWH